MQHTTTRPYRTPVGRNQSNSWRQIARHLTDMELEPMLEAYRRGAGLIRAPRGHTLTRSAFEQLCKYVGVS